MSRSFEYARKIYDSIEIEIDFEKPWMWNVDTADKQTESLTAWMRLFSKHPGTNNIVRNIHFLFCGRISIFPSRLLFTSAAGLWTDQLRSHQFDYNTLPNPHQSPTKYKNSSAFECYYRYYARYFRRWTSFGRHWDRRNSTERDFSQMLFNWHNI